MKRRMLIAALVAISATAHGGPFGLEMATPVEQLKQKLKLESSAVAGASRHTYVSRTVPQPHPLFEQFTLIATPEDGLCKIAAISKIITTSVFGDELSGEFKDVEETLSGKYGAPTDKFDYLKHGSIWEERQYWMMSLLKKDRTLTSYWQGERTTLPDSLRNIALEARALSQENGLIVLTYEFTNSKQCLQRLKAQNNSAL